MADRRRPIVACPQPGTVSDWSMTRARSGENLIPAIVDAVMAWATVGEIANRLRAVFGEHQETLVL